MEEYWTVKEGNHSLLVVVLGWAADQRVIEGLRPAGYDVVCLYDLRELALPDGFEIRIAGYRRKVLLAWSFGVWAAERLFGDALAKSATDHSRYHPPRPGMGRVWIEGVFDNSPIRFNRAIAVNGTPVPHDETKGIGSRRLAITLKGMRGAGFDAFARAAYGRWYDGLSGILWPRPDEDNLQELASLIDRSAIEYGTTINWDAAIVGEKDQIFPYLNMKNYWGSRSVSLPLPHYPFGEPELIEKELGDR